MGLGMEDKERDGKGRVRWVGQGVGWSVYVGVGRAGVG